MIGKYYYGTGRRKSSIARVFIQPGKGSIIIIINQLMNISQDIHHK